MIESNYLAGLRCDQCRVTTFGPTLTATDADQARLESRTAGWTQLPRPRKDGKPGARVDDLCPRCSERYESEHPTPELVEAVHKAADQAGRLTFTVAETSELLGLDARTVRTACKNGTIPSVKVGRLVLIPKDKLWEMLGR